MRLMMELIIGGWIATSAFAGFCALVESGRLLRLHARFGEWLESRVPAARVATYRREM
jgi:hypothetical protein